MKQGQRIIYDNQVRTIYDIYPNDMASLCLIDEDDFDAAVKETNSSS